MLAICSGSPINKYFVFLFSACRRFFREFVLIVCSLCLQLELVTFCTACCALVLSLCTCMAVSISPSVYAVHCYLLVPSRPLSWSALCLYVCAAVGPSLWSFSSNGRHITALLRRPKAQIIIIVLFRPSLSASARTSRPTDFAARFRWSALPWRCGSVARRTRTVSRSWSRAFPPELTAGNRSHRP